MQHPVLMGVRQHREQGQTDFLQLVQGQAQGALAQNAVEGRAAQQLHHDKSPIMLGVDAKAIQVHEVGMANLTHQRKFVEQQGIGVGRVGEFVIEDFQGHIGVRITQLLLQQVARAVDRAHATGAQQTLQPVAATP